MRGKGRERGRKVECIYIYRRKGNEEKTKVGKVID